MAWAFVVPFGRVDVLVMVCFVEKTGRLEALIRLGCFSWLWHDMLLTGGIGSVVNDCLLQSVDLWSWRILLLPRPV